MPAKKYKYHVTFEESKKLVSVTKKEEVFAKIVNAFKIQDTMFMLQYFDMEFQDWVDVDNIEDVPESCKLLVKKICPGDETFAGASMKVSENADESQDSQPKVANLVFLPIANEKENVNDSCPMAEAVTPTVSDTGSQQDPEANGSMTEEFGMEEGEDDNALDITMSPSSLRNSLATSDSDGENCWLSSYKTPNLPRRILTSMKLMKKHEVLERSQRKAIANALMESVLQHTRYPTSHQYSVVCSRLVTKYPMLRDKYATNGCYHRSWHQQLRNKLKQHRRSHLVDEQQKAMRRKFGGVKKRPANTTNVTATPKCKHPRWSHPYDEELQDAEKMRFFIGGLCAEMKREAPSDRFIGDIMNMTFANRRADIAAGLTTCRILTDYPCLLEAKWMLAEMKTIVNFDLLKKMNEISERKMMKIKALVINRFSRLSKATRCSMELGDAFFVAAMADLVNARNVIRRGDEKLTLPFPTIVIDRSENIHVAVDGSKITGVDDMRTALAVLVSCYWVLGLEFPSSQEKYLAFLAKYVLEIPGLKYPDSLVPVLNML